MKPFVEKNVSAAAAYRRLLGKDSPIEVVPVSRAILERSAEARAQLGGRAFDAIHVATALGTNCVSVPSEDARLRAPATVRLVRLSELSAGRRE